VALCGTLGAGKTRLVQAIAAACGVPRDLIVSPTFVLCQEYHGTRTIYHLDAYRLQNTQEFLQLGPEEFFQSDGIVLIEWADRVVECLPAERLEIDIDIGESDSRRFEIVPHGERMNVVAQELAGRLDVK
jgi:tRNA threonylcarbamoyladenosine biosynthesis protein TsaE